MKLESYGRPLDADIEKDYERKGLYNNSSSFAYDWYELSNCEPIDENMQDTIDKLQHLESDCKFGTAVELFDLEQLFEQSENVKKIIELADKKLKELQKTSPSKAQKLQELLEQAHTSDNALNDAIIQRADRDEQIAKARIERERKQEPSSTYNSYDSINKSIDDEFKRKWVEIEQSDKARRALREAEDNLSILAQLEKDPDGITSEALESVVRIYQEQIVKYQSVLGVDGKNFDAKSLREQKSRIDAKIEQLKVKFNDEIELESQSDVANAIEIEEDKDHLETEEKERLEDERKAKEEAEAKAKVEQTRREEAQAKLKAEEKARIEAERKAKEEAEAKARIEEEKKRAELAKAEARAKAETETKIEQANNMNKHTIAENKATDEKQSLSTEELETIQQVEQSLRKTFGNGFDITRLRIESEQDFKNELSQKFGLQGLQDTSEIQKKLQDMIYEGNILGADIRTPQGLRKYQLFKQVVPNFEELKSKVLQVRGYDIALEKKLFEGIDLSNISYDNILQRADSIIQEQARINSPEYQEMMKEAEQEKSIRDEVGDEFALETESQQQAREDAEIEWMQRMGSVAQEVYKTNSGVKGKQEVVKLIQELQAREKQGQIELQEEQDQQSH